MARGAMIDCLSSILLFRLKELSQDLEYVDRQVVHSLAVELGSVRLRFSLSDGCAVVRNAWREFYTLLVEGRKAGRQEGRKEGRKGCRQKVGWTKGSQKKIKGTRSIHVKRRHI